MVVRRKPLVRVRCRCLLGEKIRRQARGRSSMAEPQPSKLVMRVRFPSPAPTTNPRSSQVPPKRRVTIKKPSPSVVPDTCRIGSCWHPSAGPRRAPAPWPPRSPHPAPWWRAGKSSRHVCLCDPSVSISSRRLAPVAAAIVFPVCPRQQTVNAPSPRAGPTVALERAGPPG